MALPFEKTSTEVTVLKDQLDKKLIVTGTTVPTDATTGYAKGCIFIDTDVSTGNSAVYENIGTSTSCIFAKQGGANLSDATVSAQASTATLDNTIAGKMLTNTGASGAITLTLPLASTLTGKYFGVTVLAAQIVNMSPNSADAIFLNGSGVDNKDLILAGTIGTSAIIYSDGVNYKVISHTSGVTKEA